MIYWALEDSILECYLQLCVQYTQQVSALSLDLEIEFLVYRTDDHWDVVGSSSTGLAAYCNGTPSSPVGLRHRPILQYIMIL